MTLSCVWPEFFSFKILDPENLRNKNPTICFPNVWLGTQTLPVFWELDTLLQTKRCWLQKTKMEGSHILNPDDYSALVNTGICLLESSDISWAQDESFSKS